MILQSEKEVLEALHTLRNVCNEIEEKYETRLLKNLEDDCGLIANSMGGTHRKLKMRNSKDYNNPRMILN